MDMSTTAISHLSRCLLQTVAAVHYCMASLDAGACTPEVPNTACALGPAPPCPLDVCPCGTALQSKDLLPHGFQHRLPHCPRMHQSYFLTPHYLHLLQMSRWRALVHNPTYYKTN